MRNFAVYHKRLDENSMLPPPGSRIGHVTRLFILEVPDKISAPAIHELLRKAGRDPALMDLAVSSINIASESDWPTDVKTARTSSGVEEILWKSLEEDAKGFRRITIRVTPQLYERTEAEAKRHGRSLNQFCVDALQMQVGTRSHRIENEVFRFISMGGRSDPTRPTGLPDLLNHVAKVIPDCSFQELESALKRLHQARYLSLDKYVAPLRKYKPYDGTNNEDFFYRGDFRMGITPSGRSYSEVLSASTAALDGFRKIVRAEGLV